MAWSSPYRSTRPHKLTSGGLLCGLLFVIPSPFSADGMPTGVGPDGMALPPGAAPAPPAALASECNDLEFNSENVDKVWSEIHPPDRVVRAALCEIP